MNDRNIKPGNTPPDGDMRLVFALIIIASAGTCIATNATEDMALVACYEAGFAPEECDR